MFKELILIAFLLVICFAQDPGLDLVSAEDQEQLESAESANFGYGRGFGGRGGFGGYGRGYGGGYGRGFGYKRYGYGRFGRGGYGGFYG